MSKKSRHIPVYHLPSGVREGIFFRRETIDGPPNHRAVERSHRDNGHLFILQEKGTTRMEVDFKIKDIQAPAVLYIHPSQIHRLISFEKATTCSWFITSENLEPELVSILENINPPQTLSLSIEVFEMVKKAADLCLETETKKHLKLYETVLRQSCNTLVALVLSEYLANTQTTGVVSRFEKVTRAFNSSLEQHFITVKSPSAYATRLNISTAYLNECIKAVSGKPVTFHIQQRVILEAKRLLFHSDRSIKEIAADLGYEDFSYFTRLFIKVAGVTPVAFRNKTTNNPITAAY